MVTTVGSPGLTGGPRGGAASSGDRRGGFLLDLLSCCFRLHKQASIIPSEADVGAIAKTAIACCRFVIAFRIGKGILLPGQQRKSRTNGVNENIWGLKARQVEVAAEILHKLADCDMVPAP